MRGVNNIVDYYDKNYGLSEKSIKVTSDISHEEYSRNYKYQLNEYNSQYNKMVINANIDGIGPGQMKAIYVQFKLSREQVESIIIENENDPTANEPKILDNVVEIESYYINDMDGQTYAGVDQRSAPGNAIPGNKDTYENDTDAAPTLKLLKSNARQIKGKVFLDKTSGELKTGEVREGSGEYEEGEEGIPWVKVELISLTNGNTEGSADTNENGEFEISGFKPDEYELKYTWGGQKLADGDIITVQDYKGTIYKDKERYERNKNNKLWYKDNIDERYSDAIDKWETRETIDSEIRTKNDWQIEEFKKNKEQAPYDEMVSTTPKMNFRIENTDEIDERETTSSGIKLLEYSVENVDFGIVERARQEVELRKRVSEFKVTLANDQVVSDVKFEYDQNGKLKAKSGSVTTNLIYMGTRDKNNKIQNNGFIKLELDNELIQGSKLSVKYEIEFYNKSEKDYRTQDYYWFGKIDNEDSIIKITPTKIIDYLDDTWSFELNKNEGWEVITEEDLKKEENGVSLLHPELKNDKIEERFILCKEWEEKAAPGETITTNLNVAKLLSSTDEILLQNDIGILQMDKTGGSIIPRIPGKYIPGKDLDELSDKSEEIIITPSTGKNLNFVLPIAIGIVALITLGTGVILIKKKVVDNK